MNQAADTPPPSRSGPLSSTTGRLVAATVVVLIAVGAGILLPRLFERSSATGGSPSPSASPTPSATTAPTESPSPEPTDTPSPTPVSGELPTGPAGALLSFTPTCDVVPPVNVPATTVFTDGRVIWRADDGGLQIRQLTPESLDDFTEQVNATGLFETSASFDLERRPDTPDPPGHGLCHWGFVWNDGGEDVEVGSVMWLGAEEEAMYYEPSPERETLHALAEQLMDPPTWYDDEGWVQPEAVPYEPEAYLVLASVTVPQLATESAPDFDDVSWPFDEGPDEFGVEYRIGGDPPSRCDHASAEAIEAFAQELTDAGLEQFEQSPFYGTGAALPWAARGAAVDFSFWPALPDGRPTCEESGG